MKAIEKFNHRADTINSLVCVGLDTDIHKLPDPFLKEAKSQLAFNRYIIDETAEFTAAYKFNIAFYEARGVAGLEELRLSVDYLCDQHPDILIICDAKRADLDNTSVAYAQALFDHYGFDAVTLNPYLGRSALKPFLDYPDKGCIILCRTSNAGSSEFQDLLVGDQPLWHIVAEKVARKWNNNNNCMLVIGANHPDQLAQVRAIVGDMTLLIPGVGAQGGDVQSVIESGLNSQNKGLIISSSRGIIFSADPKSAAKSLRDNINQYRS